MVSIQEEIGELLGLLKFEVDPQILLVGAVTCTLLAGFIYFLSIVGAKEKSYEEAIAEQAELRRQQEQTLRTPKTEPKTTKDAKRFRHKKRKPNKSGDIEVKQEHFSHEEECILSHDQEVSSPSMQQPAKKDENHVESSKRSAKSGKTHISKILEPKPTPHNQHRAGPSEGTTGAPVTFSCAEQDNLDKAQQDDDADEEEEEYVQQEVAANAKVEDKQDSLTQTTVAVSSSKTSSQQENIQHQHIKKQRKNRDIKNESNVLQVDHNIPASQLISLVKKMALQEQDVHTLVEILLNKQNDGRAGENWTKKDNKSDNIAILKKQLEEKEEQLIDGRNTANAAWLKLKEFRQELAQEKLRYAQLEQKSKEKIIVQGQEVQSLQARMQQTHDHHRAELNNVHQQLEQLKARALNPEQALTIQHLNEENQHMKDVISKQEQNCSDLNSRLQRLQNELVATTDKTTKHAIEVSDSRNKLRSAEERNMKLQSELDAAGDQTKALLEEISSLKDKIKEIEVDKVMMESLQQKVEHLERESSRLSMAASAKEERNKLNGDVNPQTDVRLKEKEKVIRRITEEMLTNKREIAALNTRVESELQMRYTSEAQLVEQKEKNNKLREKNWKAMEAMNAAEKNWDDRLNSVIKSKQESAEAVEKQSKQMFTQLFPTVQVKDNVDFGTWLADMEKGGLNLLKSLETEVEKLKKECSELKKVPSQTSVSEAEQLKHMKEVEHYKKVLADTEAHLKRLESSVELEDENWRKRQRVMESQLTEVKAEKLKLEENLEEIRIAEEAAAEMQKQLQQLQVRLKTEEEEHKHLKKTVAESDVNKRALERAEEQLQTVSNELIAKQKQFESSGASLAAKNEQLAETEIQLNKQQQFTDNLNQKLQENREALKTLSENYEKEQLAGQELSKTVSRLNGIVKIGQDAVQSEQDHAKSLQQELDAMKSKYETKFVCNTEEVGEEQFEVVHIANNPEVQKEMDELKQKLEKSNEENSQLQQELTQVREKLVSGSSLRGTSI